MERTTQIFLTVGKVKVEEEEEKGEEEGRVKIESVSAWVKKEVGASEEGGLVAVRAEEMAVKEELEIDAPEYKGLLPYIEFDVKEEWSDFKKAEEEEKDLEDKEEEEVSADLVTMSKLTPDFCTQGVLPKRPLKKRMMRPRGSLKRRL